MIALMLACIPPERVRYDGHSVVRVHVGSAGELDAVLSATSDVWSHSVTDHVDVRVDRRGRAALDGLGLSMEVLVPDLQDAIEASHAAADWEDLQDVLDRLDDLGAASPWARIVDLGTSHEGHPVRGLEIATGTAPDDQPGIVITGVQHAREWVAGSSALSIASRLALDYGADPDATALLDAYRVLVVPIVNPDGYRYSWTTDRLWRKNRRDNGDGTWGVDLNRNWDLAWGTLGSSADPGHANYRGPAPFSEPEVLAVADLLRDRPHYDRHLDLHSTGQLVLYPWAFVGVPAPDDAVLAAGGADIAAAMSAVHGSPYDPGQVFTQLYPASGVSIDWAHGRHGMHSFLLELRDRGQYGFLLPADQIVPTAEEAWAALLQLAAIPEPARLWLDAGPPVAGGTLTIDVWRAEPGAAIEVAASTTGWGSTTIPPGPPLELDQAFLLGSAVADAEGHGTVQAQVPGHLVAGDRLLLQAYSDTTLSTLLELEVQ